jgi:hypothetical protein
MFALLFIMFHGAIASRRCWHMRVVGRFVGSPCCVSPFKSWHVSIPAAIFLNYKLSDPFTYCPSWEANSSSASQIPAFYRTRSFIAMLTPAHHMYLSWAIWIQRSSLSCDATQHILVVSYRRFGTNCRSHIRGSSSPRRMPATRRCKFRTCHQP